MRAIYNSHFLKNTLKINIFKIRIMERSIAECFDFEELVGRSDAVYNSTRAATTAQKFKRKALYIGLIMISEMRGAYK